MEMMFHTTLRCGKLDGKLNCYSALINIIKNTNENELNRKNTLKMKKENERKAIVGKIHRKIETIGA